MWKRVPKVLTVLQIEELLTQPDADEKLGLRDKAMLEFAYATGMRVMKRASMTRIPMMPISVGLIPFLSALKYLG